MIERNDHFEDVLERQFLNSRNRQLQGDDMYVEKYRERLKSDSELIGAHVWLYASGLAFFGLFIAAGFGYLWEYVGVALVVSLMIFALRVRMRFRLENKVSEIAEELSDRRQGVDRRWGRLGAEKKTKFRNRSV